MEIKDIVDVEITKEQASQNIRDLNTTLILCKTKTADDIKEYTDSRDVLEDGYTTSDYVYKSVSKMFAQSPRPRRVMVGKVENEVTPDYVEDLNKLVAYSSEWFFVMTDAETTEDKMKIAEFVETQDIFYVAFDDDVKTEDKTDTTNLAYLVKNKSLMRTIVFYDTLNGMGSEAAWIGRHSSFILGSNLWGYKTLATLEPLKFTKREARRSLEENRCVFYTTVGKDKVSVGTFEVGGGELMKNILGIAWLKNGISEDTWNILYVNEVVNFTNASLSLFQAALYKRLTDAVDLGILSGDEPFNIFIPDANSFTSQQRESGILDNITFSARLANAIVYVRGIRGVVRS